MNKHTRELALKEMNESANATKDKYASGGSAKVRKEVCTKGGKAIRKK